MLFTDLLIVQSPFGIPVVVEGTPRPAGAALLATQMPPPLCHSFTLAHSSSPYPGGHLEVHPGSIQVALHPSLLNSCHMPTACGTGTTSHTACPVRTMG